MYIVTWFLLFWMTLVGYNFSCIEFLGSIFSVLQPSPNFKTFSIIPKRIFMPFCSHSSSSASLSLPPQPLVHRMWRVYLLEKTTASGSTNCFPYKQAYSEYVVKYVITYNLLCSLSTVFLVFLSILCQHCVSFCCFIHMVSYAFISWWHVDTFNPVFGCHE